MAQATFSGRLSGPAATRAPARGGAGVLGDQLVEDRMANVRVGRERATGQEPPVAGPLAGFGSWLAGRMVPLAQRRLVHSEVARFLEWQRSEFPYDPAMQRPAIWCYLLKRQREDCDDAEALRLWGALELFLVYVESRRVGRPV